MEKRREVKPRDEEKEERTSPCVNPCLTLHYSCANFSTDAALWPAALHRHKSGGRADEVSCIDQQVMNASNAPVGLLHRRNDGFFVQRAQRAKVNHLEQITSETPADVKKQRCLPYLAANTMLVLQPLGRLQGVQNTN